jgi:hypothetical protein
VPIAFVPVPPSLQSVPSAKFMASAASSRIRDEVRGNTLQSPNVLLNQMSREERGEYVAKYKRGGPGGRPAAA